MVTGLPRPGTPQFDAALKNAKIMMVVDDDPLVTALVQKCLARAGYGRFVSTNNPLEAIALMKHEKPDLVLLDVLMHNLSGFELLEAVRCDELLEATPIIMLTAESTAEAKLCALQIGATDFLSKPVDPSELVPRVRNTLAFLQYRYRVANFDSAIHLPGHQLFDTSVDAVPSVGSEAGSGICRHSLQGDCNTVGALLDARRGALGLQPDRGAAALHRPP